MIMFNIIPDRTLVLPVPAPGASLPVERVVFARRAAPGRRAHLPSSYRSDVKLRETTL